MALTAALTTCTSAGSGSSPTIRVLAVQGCSRVSPSMRRNRCEHEMQRMSMSTSKELTAVPVADSDINRRVCLTCHFRHGAPAVVAAESGFVHVT